MHFGFLSVEVSQSQETGRRVAVVLDLGNRHDVSQNLIRRLGSLGILFASYILPPRCLGSRPRQTSASGKNDRNNPHQLQDRSAMSERGR